MSARANLALLHARTRSWDGSPYQRAYREIYTKVEGAAGRLSIPMESPELLQSGPIRALRVPIQRPASDRSAARVLSSIAEPEREHNEGAHLLP
jgi:hypothetical protein